MSSQSGITCSPTLIEAINRENRAIIIQIKELKFELVEEIPVKSTWEEDLKLIKVTALCFILFKRSCGNILFQYVPDGSLVKDKVLLSASKAALVRETGECEFIFCTVPKEISLENIKLSLNPSVDATTSEEKDLMRLNLLQAQEAVGISTKSSNHASINFPFTKPASDALMGLKQTGNLVLLTIVDEKTDLLESQSVDFSGLKDAAAKFGACFLFYSKLISSKQEVLILHCLLDPTKSKLHTNT